MTAKDDEVGFNPDAEPYTKGKPVPEGRPFPCNLCRQGTLRLRRGSIKGKRNTLFYSCDNYDCDGFISAHQSHPYHPMGVPADAQTRKLRQEVHKTIDPLWMEGNPEKRKQRRTNLYRWLSDELGLKHYHTADLDADGCYKTMGLVRGKKPEDFEQDHRPPKGERPPKPKRNTT